MLKIYNNFKTKHLVGFIRFYRFDFSINCPISGKTEVSQKKYWISLLPSKRHIFYQQNPRTVRNKILLMIFSEKKKKQTKNPTELKLRSGSTTKLVSFSSQKFSLSHCGRTCLFYIGLVSKQMYNACLTRWS